MAIRQTGEVYQIRNTQDMSSAMGELNALLARLTTRLDRIEGLSGTPTYHGTVNVNGQALQNLPNPADPGSQQAAPISQVLSSIGKTGQYRAKSLRITELADGQDDQDAATLAQLRDAQATVDLHGESFVVIALSSALTAERQLAGEATVITITDAGAGSTVTIEVTANGITNAKLRQSVAVSVIGRSANSAGNVADIAAAANGNVLRRAANVVGFGQIDLSDGANAVTGATAIANGGTGQTAQTAAFNALDPLTTKGDLIVHDGTNSIRVAVGSNGQLLVANSAATPGVAWQGTAQTYTVTNGTTDRSYDADTVVVAELADVVFTLIEDLKSFGILT